MTKWLAPQGDIAVETRIALMRNFADVPFDAGMTNEEAAHIVSRVGEALSSAGQREAFVLCRLSDMTAAESGRLAEHGLMDFSLLKYTQRAAVFLSKGGTINIGVGGINHIQIDACLPGLQLERTADLCFTADHWLDQSRAYAYDSQFGFLTADPMAAGAGMAVAIGLHLPLLRASGQIVRHTRELSERHLTLKKRYQEKSEPGSGFYQLTGAVRLGQSEEGLLETLLEAAQTLIGCERALREQFLEQDRLLMEDRAARTLALVGAARLMSEEEMLQRCSEIRLAAALDLMNGSGEAIDRLISDLGNASIDCCVTEKLTARQRDRLRADMLRESVTRLGGMA